MRRAAIGLGALVLLVGSCSPRADVVTVLAASSAGPLLESHLAEAPTPTSISLGGSQQLAAAVRGETPAGLGLDLLILADPDLAADLGTEFPELGAPIPWVSTTLSVVAAPGAAAPRDLVSLLGHDGLSWVVAADGVPLGTATRRALGNDFARVEPHVVSYEDSAGAVLAKVASGEVDVAVVYSANAAAAVARGDLQVLHTFGPDASVTIVLQPVTDAGRVLADLLLRDVAAIRRAGFEPAS